MLKEYPAHQFRGEPTRRWFSDDYFDIIIWQNQSTAITRFQLCYDKSGKERALTWAEGKGISHNMIDKGEGSPLKNQSPILLADGLFPADEVLRLFVANSGAVDAKIRSFIIETLRMYK